MADAQSGRADAMCAWLRRHAARTDLLADLGAAGLFALQVAEADGGPALSHAALVRVFQQLAAIDLAAGVAAVVHNCLGLRPLLQFGPRALQQALLPGLARGCLVAAYAQAEPATGSSVAAMRTRARRVDGGWQVSGIKGPVATTSAAALLTVLARACDAAGAPLGPIALVVPADADGVVHEQPAAMLGLRCLRQGAVGFDAVFVPDTHVLLAPGEGERVAQDAAAFAQLGIGALCAGALMRCAQLMLGVATPREIATGPLLDNPVTLARLHGLACGAWSLEALAGALAAGLDERSAMPHHACAALKCAGAELLWQGADALLQLMGADGCLDASPAAVMLRDARALRLIGGANEALYMQLGAAAAPDSGAERFLSAGLGRAAVAAELGRAVCGIRARASTVRPFDAQPAAIQWLDYRVGELSASAVLLGAAEWRAEREPGADARAAIAWTRGRFDAQCRAIEAEQAQGAVAPAATALQRRIGAFATAIGVPG